MEKKIEIKRKIAHFLFGIVLVILIGYDVLDKYSIGVIILLGLVVSYISKKKKIKFIEKILDNFERPLDRKNFPGKGLIYYLIGSELCLILFSKDIALASIMILAVGDSIPKLVGMQFSKIKAPFSDKRFLEGVFAGIILSFLGAAIFVEWYLALAASIIAVFIEGIDMKFGLERIDDNIIVPLVSGLVIWLIRQLIFVSVA